MKKDSFIKRFLIIFIPLLVFLVLMELAGITDNIFMTILLSLCFVWMVQAIYRRHLLKRQQEEEESNN